MLHLKHSGEMEAKVRKPNRSCVSL